MLSMFNISGILATSIGILSTTETNLIMMLCIFTFKETSFHTLLDKDRKDLVLLNKKLIAKQSKTTL